MHRYVDDLLYPESMEKNTHEDGVFPFFMVLLENFSNNNGIKVIRT